jgi:hypothetical protein
MSVLVSSSVRHNADGSVYADSARVAWVLHAEVCARSTRAKPLHRLVRDDRGTIAEVHLFASGGDFTEAMKIGRAIRALELSSRVPARSASGSPSCSGPVAIEPKDQTHCTCASACFFIHVAGTDRRGDYLAVHRPSFAPGAFGRMSQKDAMKVFDALQRTADAPQATK